MNLQSDPPAAPVCVVAVNPASVCSQLVLSALASGAALGATRRLRLKLLAYPDEVARTEQLCLQLESCAFCCIDSIEIFHELHSIFDSADILCFRTNLPNPNRLIVNPAEELQQETLEALEQIKLIAQYLGDSLNKAKQSELLDGGVRKKPIIITDGLISLHILSAVVDNASTEMFFCPTVLTTIGKSVLGEYLKVKCDVINDLLIWAANDETFHIEVEKPLILHDDFEGSKCDWELIGKDFMESLNLDHTQFNGSWIKKEFVEKTKNMSMKNPYGDISKAHVVVETLKTIWSSGREENVKKKIYCNMGIISDGSYGTERGMPCVLPIVFHDGKWSVNKRYENDSHVQNEMKKIYMAMKQQSDELKFLRDELLAGDPIRSISGET